MKRTHDQMEDGLSSPDPQSSESTQPLPRLVDSDESHALAPSLALAPPRPTLDSEYRGSPMKKYRGMFEGAEEEEEGGDLFAVMSSLFSKPALPLVPLADVVVEALDESLTVPLENNEISLERLSLVQPHLAPVPQHEEVQGGSHNLSLLIDKVEEDFSSRAVHVEPKIPVGASAVANIEGDEDDDGPIISIPRKLPRWMMDKAHIAELEAKNLEERLLLKNSMVFNSHDPEVAAAEARPQKYNVLTELEPLMQDRVIVFDTETTGFTLSDGVLEIGAIEIRNGARTGFMFHSLIKSPAQIHSQAFKIHGINEAAVANSQPPFAVLLDFLKWVNKSPLVVHNAIFDMRLMLQDLERYRLGHMLADQPVFDTMPYYRRLQATRDYTLNDAARRYDIPLTARYQHTALVDADILGSVFLAMAREVAGRKSGTIGASSDLKQ